MSSQCSSLAPGWRLRSVNDSDVPASPIGRQVEQVKLLFEAFERRDVEAALALMDPDVRFMPVTAQIMRGGRPYEGHEGIREYHEDVAAIWEELELVPVEYQAVAGVVVVIGEVRGRADGELRAPAIWTWELRNGLIVEGSVHSALESARAALGVRGSSEGASERSSAL